MDTVYVGFSSGVNGFYSNAEKNSFLFKVYFGLFTEMLLKSSSSLLFASLCLQNATKRINNGFIYHPNLEYLV